MLLLRSLLFQLYFSLVTAFYGIALGTIGMLTPLAWRNWLCRYWARHTLAGLGVICGLRYRVTGLDKLSLANNAVILAKHQSAWETISLRMILPPQQGWVVKRELLYIPLFGWGLAATRPIAINRGTPRAALRQVLERGETLLRAGFWVVIFPEGTRVAYGERGRYAASGATLAKRAGVSVIPLAHNAGLFWPRNGLIKQPGVIDIVFGDPISTEAKTAQQITDEAEAWIEEQIGAMPSDAVSSRFS